MNKSEEGCFFKHFMQECSFVPLTYLSRNQCGMCLVDVILWQNAGSLPLTIDISYIAICDLHM